MADFLFRGKLADLDPAVFEINQLEAERQFRKLLLIPSESTAPASVRESLGSMFQNLYAEGYPDENSRRMDEDEILNFPDRLSDYRRHADPRYYKGVEYADIIEALARRRCAELFATPEISADQMYVNVQPLSGAPANNAVYTALLNPGDAMLAMSLLHGGHLTHGSSANRSGKLYKVSHYTVDPETEQIDYDALETLARESNPKIIIAGYSSYSWLPDWARFRAIADSVGAILMADISHIAGLIAGKAAPSPVGYAQVITFTTHKTLCGPRGACILTTDAALSRKLDRGIFPGEQGGPHIHTIAALATAFKLANGETFRQLQHQIIRNSITLTSRLQERGLRISYGGTDSHLANVDCKTIIGRDGTTLSGDMAARILDVAGIVLNRNTIPGDKSALNPSGIRFGTPWMTQRGLQEEDMVQVADIMANVLLATTPYSVESSKGPVQRAKVDFNVLEESKLAVRSLTEKAGADYQPACHGYPHFYYIDDKFHTKDGWSALEIQHGPVLPFVNHCFSSDVDDLQPGASQPTSLVTPRGQVDGVLKMVHPGLFRFSMPTSQAGLAATFLRALSDGYCTFDPQEVLRIPGPVVIAESEADPDTSASGSSAAGQKPYFIGMEASSGEPLPEFEWHEVEAPLRQTALHEVHRQLGAKMVPFAGWDMPVWYSSVVEEHLATRQAAGLFDVSHMGVYQAEGPHAVEFLDSVCGNDISSLAVGESCYTHFLDPQANVIDDTLVYRRAAEKYLVVVNASNDDKDWAWLNAVLQGMVSIDKDRPWLRAFGRGTRLRNLRDPQAGTDMLVDIALQGPKSREILLALGGDVAARRQIMALKRTELCEAKIGKFDLVVSRTGYTGERMAFELFVHPDHAVDLWNALLTAGTPLGLKPCGLGARDSLRTEAGLPLYGHEMGGDLGLGVAEAGFGGYVKLYKPWFIGRQAYLEREQNRGGVVVRFRFNEKGVRMARLHDPVLDAKGRMIGSVTSCTIDTQGFLTGQAFIETRYAQEGTAISIYQDAPKIPCEVPAELKTGERVILPTPATVSARFPRL